MTDTIRRPVAGRAPATAVTTVSPRRRILLGIELSGFALGIPLAIAVSHGAIKLPILVLLLPVLGLILFSALTDDTLRLGRELARGIRRHELTSIALLFAVGASSLTAWVLLSDPAKFLAMPADRPSTWLTIMIVYPIFSALPQELAFRTFFFHRYEPLLPSRRWLAIALNGALFGFAHIIYGSFVSVGLTCILGTLLAYRYLHTRSFWAVWLEHTLYGELVFTIGLGHYFIMGAH